MYNSQNLFLLSVVNIDIIKQYIFDVLATLLPLEILNALILIGSFCSYLSVCSHHYFKIVVIIMLL